MIIKALTSFVGALSMHKGQVIECGDNAVLHDLLNAGYIEEVKGDKPQKGAASNESKRNNK